MQTHADGVPNAAAGNALFTHHITWQTNSQFVFTYAFTVLPLLSCIAVLTGPFGGDCPLQPSVVFSLRTHDH